jgi:hypothetical protein
MLAHEVAPSSAASRESAKPRRRLVKGSSAAEPIVEPLVSSDANSFAGQE